MPSKIPSSAAARPRAAAGFALVFLLAAPSLDAATVEVMVHSPEGLPLRNIQVLLEKGTPHLPRYSRFSATDQQGLASFFHAPLGIYTLTFRNLPEPWLDPSANPYDTAPSFTVRHDDGKMRLDLTLAEGVPVEVTTTLNGAPSAVGRVRFRHRSSGLEVSSGYAAVGNRPVARRLLSHGLWDVTVQGPPGYLLVGVDRGGDPLPGYQASVDLSLAPSPAALAWHFAVPCEIEGSVSASGGDPTQAVIEATLLEPGPWIDAARARGGSSFEKVSAGVSRRGRYALRLPDGLWRVAPAGRIEASDPPYADLRLAPGDTGTADFHVTFMEPEDRSRESVLMVAVGNEVATLAGRYDDRTRPERAAVEVFRLRDRELVASSETRGDRARIAGLPAGDYVVAASHPDFLEAMEEVRDFAADPEKPRFVHLELPLGARIRFEAVDSAGKPLRGAELSVERRGPPPPLTAKDADFLAAKLGRRATADHSGRAAMSGFYAGFYRLKATVRGLGSRSRVELLDLTLGGSPADPLGSEAVGPETVVELVDGQLLDVSARLKPSARLTTTLACSDGWALPEAARITVFDAFTWDGAVWDEAALTGLSSGKWPVEPVLDLADFSPRGRQRDTLEIGPLPPGLYRLSVRPVGFDRTTWAFETYDPREASEIQVRIGEGETEVPFGLGPFHLECGPAVDIVPEVASGDPFPEAHRVDVRVQAIDLRTQEDVSDRVTVTARDGHFEVRDLPRGRLRLDFVLSHPHFLPARALRWQVDVALERGSYDEVAPLLEAIGGAIRVEGDGVRARLSGPGGTRTVEAAGSSTLFASLVPGTYEVTLCADPECDTLSRQWGPVRLTAGRTVVLR